MLRFGVELDLSEGAILAALEGAPGAFFLRDGGAVFFGAYPIGGSTELVPTIEPSSVPSFDDVPAWVGVLPYEAFRGLERGFAERGDPRPTPAFREPLWCRYEAAGRIDDGRVRVFGSNQEAVARLAETLLRGGPFERPAVLLPIGPVEDREVHAARVRTALEAIARGDLYQVNLARRFRFAAVGSAMSFLHTLGERGDAPYAAALSFGALEIVSSSPELFLSIDGDGRIETRPIKGTRPRDRDPARDLALRAELDGSEKERAELTMVIDLERNDLGRVCRVGTVQVTEMPRVLSHATVHHREATVSGILSDGVSHSEAVLAMSPSGSVTGAPKIRAMELIAALEAHRRGLYTGSLGYLSEGGRLRLSMAIRVLGLHQGEGHYFAGGGIVADSDPRAEIDETEWKAEQLRSLVR